MSSAGIGSTVSVVVPVMDGERFLAEGLASVLGQTRPADEVVVIDGDSRDRSRQIAASHDGVTVIDQRGAGLCNAWNEAIERSSGSLISFLDCDDRWRPGKLAAQVGLLEARPELDIAIGRVRYFLEPGHEPPLGLRPELLEGELEALMPTTMLIRRTSFDRVGAFDEDYRIAGDMDWFARAKDVGLRVHAVPELVAEKRCHDGNLSHSDIATNHSELVRMARESITRQRQGR